MDVICAVDGSSAAPGVVSYATEVASRTGAALRIVRAVQVADPLIVNPGVVRAIEDPAERRAQVLERAQRQLDELCAQASGVEASADLRQGTTGAAVLDAVAEHDAELVVLGTRAGSGGRAAVGRDAQHIIRRAPCPVLVVPDGYDRKLGNPMIVVVGIRGGDREDAAVVVREADKLAQLVRAEIVIAHSERKDGDAAWLEEVAGGRRHIAARGNPAPELLRIADETTADAVAVAPRGHGRLRQALLGSVSSALLSAGERPVFVIPRTHKTHG
jgi:universal stress protein A